MIRIDCPVCGKTLKVADEAAGKTGKCPQCNERFKVPKLKPAASQTSVAPAPPKRPTIVRPQLVRDPLPVPVQVTPTVVAVQLNQPSKASHSLGIGKIIISLHNSVCVAVAITNHEKHFGMTLFLVFVLSHHAAPSAGFACNSQQMATKNPQTHKTLRSFVSGADFYRWALFLVRPCVCVFSIRPSHNSQVQNNLRNCHAVHLF